MYVLGRQKNPDPSSVVDLWMGVQDKSEKWAL